MKGATVCQLPPVAWNVLLLRYDWQVQLLTSALQ